MEDRECNKCVYSTRDGNCRKWDCEGTKTVKDIKAEGMQEFANWLVKYNVIPEPSMNELIRDFKGECGL